VNKRNIFLGLSIISIFSLILTILIVQPALDLSPLSSDDPDWMAIETTLRTYAEIKEEALYTLDDSRLVEVLANDPRGGFVDPVFLKRVQWMKGNADLKLEEVGFLDTEQSRYAFERKVKELYETAIASGEVAVPTPPPYDPSANPVSEDIRGTDLDPRMHYQPDVHIVPEVKALEQETGFLGRFPPQMPDKIVPIGFKILSISVKDDLAYAKVDWDYGLCEDILVNKNGNWYLIGHKVIVWHSG